MDSEGKELEDKKVNGRYVCPYPDCGKTFSRYEHLRRHMLNHWPKKIYRCEYVYPDTGIMCNRTFVRKDLLVRHQKRHLKNSVRMKPKVQKDEGKAVAGQDQAQGTAVVKQQETEALKPGGQQPILEPLIADKLDHIVLDVGDNRASKQDSVGGGTPANDTVSEYDSGNSSLSNLNQGVAGASGAASVPSNPNLNSFFNWLFATNPADTTGSSSSSGPSNQQTPLSTNYAGNEHVSHLNTGVSQHTSLPHMRSQQPNNPVDLAMHNMPQPQNLEHDPTMANPSLVTGTVMDDLFSVDFLPNDPLQSLVQQLSYAENNDSLNDIAPVSTPSKSGSVVSPSNAGPSRSPKFKDVGKENIKDNLLAQKSNVDQLRSELKRSEDFSSHANESQPLSKKHKSTILLKPTFFNSDPNSKFKLSDRRQQEFAMLIADVKYILLSDLQISLKSYWLNFHPQYPILHKPSFDIDKEAPLLVLSMIMTGASYLGSENRRLISDIIAGPLRWLIFSHEDFQPTSKTYIIQALLLLECYEKTSTNRYLHERSYLHHGTTIQLLRRTPSLGGHPLRIKKEQSPSDTESIEETYRNWIDFETLKRTALYAFYIDTTHAVVFGYMYLFINCNQIQLSLPCADEIWDSHDLSYEKLLQHGFGGRNISFLDSLKQLLHNVMYQLQRPDQVVKWNRMKTSRFGEKLLLSGLISIMFQLQQHSEVLSFGGGNSLGVPDIHWEEIISFAIDYWHQEVILGCKNVSNSVLSQMETSEDDEIKLLRLDDVYTCKIPAFHMTQIFLRIFQYDYYIYAGAPWRMNVRAGSEEYALVSERIHKFSLDPMKGGMAMVYAYMFLFEMFQNGEDLSCDMNLDYCITRPNTLALTTLLIWSCNYSLYGPETRIWDNSPDADPASNSRLKSDYVPLQSFQEHLKKMYSYLRLDSTLPVYQYHQQIQEKAKLLRQIPNTHHLAGMMLFMRDVFEGCYWELGREFCHLFDNCLERSIGREKVVCDHMYET